MQRAATAETAPAVDRQTLLERYVAVRAETTARAAPLSAEDQVVQSMPDTSPTKWHLAHTTWFFEVLVLGPHAPTHQPLDRRWHALFNSYYESLGPRHPRPQRGLLSRPSLDEVMAYRRHVDKAMRELIAHAPDPALAAAAWAIELGLNHEQQHQELLYTDILHLLSHNPLQGACDAKAPALPASGRGGWLQLDEQAYRIGHAGESFAFDNETPCHRVQVGRCRIAERLVTNGEFLDFMRDGGYRRAGLWLSDGWAQVQAQGWSAPLYWHCEGDQPLARFTLRGPVPWVADEPACHLSWYEAAAYAEWAGARLPTEFEWEAAARLPDANVRLADLYGAVWQWTRSSYDPYPRYRPWSGAAGEYNGKFMVGQIVLRGSSLATPAGHSRPSYRNFFAPAARWQFTGLRLARDD